MVRTFSEWNVSIFSTLQTAYCQFYFLIFVVLDWEPGRSYFDSGSYHAQFYLFK